MRALARAVVSIGALSKYLASGACDRHRRIRSEESVGNGTGAAGVRTRLAGQIQCTDRAGLRVDPQRAQAPPACDAATALGGIRRVLRRSCLPAQLDLRNLCRWEKRLKRSMRQRHFAGQKLFVDYAGRAVAIFFFRRSPIGPGRDMDRERAFHRGNEHDVRR